nr:MAG TPA: hypothetical protein [Caudoviricetes sp.]
MSIIYIFYFLLFFWQFLLTFISSFYIITFIGNEISRCGLPPT